MVRRVFAGFDTPIQRQNLYMLEVKMVEQNTITNQGSQTNFLKEREFKEQADSNGTLLLFTQQLPERPAGRILRDLGQPPNVVQIQANFAARDVEFTKEMLRNEYRF